MNKVETNTVHLLKKWQKGLFNLLFSRIILVIPLLLLQFLALFAMFFRLEDFLPQIAGIQFLLILVMVLYLINGSLDPAAKITWLVLIMALPIFGSLLYLFSQIELGHRVMRKYVGDKISNTAQLLPLSEQTLAGLDATRPGAASMAGYIYKNGGYPVWSNTSAEYLPLGEDMLSQLLNELEKAEKFIFLEYFIVEEGQMWGQVLDILIRKAAQGVDIRIIYDGTCEFLLLPKGYPKKLAEFGIQCRVFSPFTPMLSTHYNYRDHRKIAVIDGRTAFTGGINLADEYINLRPQIAGHWKDTAVMLKGAGVQSLTLMFLQNWSVLDKNAATELLLPTSGCSAEGYVIPYGDNPLDKEQVGKHVYMDMLNRAQKNVFIMTPYLILDAETENVLKYTAARGVSVKMILPGIPDKQTPYALARTHYETLLNAGVEIYEYTPGFVHAKVFLCDDIEAVVGTINLDYRSLYHHFECAAYLCGCACIPDIAEDFKKTLAQCRKIETDTLKHFPRWQRILGKICKPFAPLM